MFLFKSPELKIALESRVEIEILIVFIRYRYIFQNEKYLFPVTLFSSSKKYIIMAYCVLVLGDHCYLPLLSFLLFSLDYL